MFVMASFDDARDAVLDAIVGAAKALEQTGPGVRAQGVRELAWAFRAIKGGAQPGASIVDKSS